MNKIFKMPTNEEIKALKRAKELGVEIPKDIEIQRIWY